MADEGDGKIMKRKTIRRRRKNDAGKMEEKGVEKKEEGGERSVEGEEANPILTRMLSVERSGRGSPGLLASAPSLGLY